MATKARRSLGIGFIGLAHYLAKLGYNYDSQEAWGCGSWFVRIIPILSVESI